MIKLKLLIILFAVILHFNSAAQQASTEKFGKTFNAGLGIGYYPYADHSMPVLHLNYEFDVAKNFTLAPFITIYSYSNSYYWDNPHYPSKYYSYRETVIPIGVKGAYYFDQLFSAGPKWDFYAASSIGFRIRTVRWDSDYYGDKYAYNDAPGLYLDFHAGAEYHINKKIGVFLDLSTDVSTIGLSFHH